MNTIVNKVVEQVGGTHYGPATKFGHWDYCVHARVPYLEGNATKYLIRWKNKNGLQDLEKCLSYIDKRLATLVGNDRLDGNRAEAHKDLWDRFLADNAIDPFERVTCFLIFNWETRDDLIAARRSVGFLMRETKLEMLGDATSSYTNQG